MVEKLTVEISTGHNTDGQNVDRYEISIKMSTNQNSDK